MNFFSALLGILGVIVIVGLFVIGPIVAFLWVMAVWLGPIPVVVFVLACIVLWACLT